MLWNPASGCFAGRWAWARDAQVVDADYQNKEDILDALKLYQAAYNMIMDMKSLYWFEKNVIETNDSLLRAFILNTDFDPGPLIRLRVESGQMFEEGRQLYFHSAPEI